MDWYTLGRDLAWLLIGFGVWNALHQIGQGNCRCGWPETRPKTRLLRQPPDALHYAQPVPTRRATRTSRAAHRRGASPVLCPQSARQSANASFRHSATAPRSIALPRRQADPRAPSSPSLTSLALNVQQQQPPALLRQDSTIARPIVSPSSIAFSIRPTLCSTTSIPPSAFSNSLSPSPFSPTNAASRMAKLHHGPK